MSSSRLNSNSVNEIVASTNNVIQENLSKLYEKIALIKTDLISEDEDEYENFYNRINFYFSTMLSELKLNYLETLKEYQKREEQLNQEIQRLKEINTQNEKDILELMVENMLLKIENDNYEEKNLLNISHYVDLSPQPYSDSQTNSSNNFNSDPKVFSNKKNKKSRNITSTTEDLSFKTELKNNINLKIKKKLGNNFIPYNTNTVGVEQKKKSNLTSFLNHANFINHIKYTPNMNANSQNNIIKSVTPNKLQVRYQNTHKHYKSFTGENNPYNNNIIKHKREDSSYIEKSMCNLPSYSLGKVRLNEKKLKCSLNDLNMPSSNKNNNQKQQAYFNLVNKSICKTTNSNIASNLNHQRGKSLNQNYKKISSVKYQLSTNSHKNKTNLSNQSSGGSNDFEKYKTHLMNRITGGNINPSMNPLKNSSNSITNKSNPKNIFGIFNHNKVYN